MEAQQHVDDQSHYEISLTASQAFLAFVLLLLSLAASFAFGLMIGRGQADDRLVVRREPAIVTEGSVVASGKKPQEGRIVELGVENNDFTPATDSSVTTTGGDAPTVVEETATSIEAAAPAAMTAPADASVAAAPAPEAAKPQAAAPAKSEPATAKPFPAPQVKLPANVPAVPAKGGPVYAQLLSTGDQKRAEALAAKLIDGGFPAAYVERGTNDKGTVYRVRVRFPGEAEARAAEPRLKAYSPDVWIDRN